MMIHVGLDIHPARDSQQVHLRTAKCACENKLTMSHHLDDSIRSPEQGTRDTDQHRRDNTRKARTPFALHTPLHNNLVSGKTRCPSETRYQSGAVARERSVPATKQGSVSSSSRKLSHWMRSAHAHQVKTLDGVLEPLDGLQGAGMGALQRCLLEEVR